MVNKKTKQAIAVFVSLFLCAVLIFGAAISLVSFDSSASILNAFAAEASNDSDLGDTNESFITTFAAENTNSEDVLYLSDRSRITHDKSSFSLGNSRLFMAPEQVANIPNKVVQAKIEGAWYTFEYGVYAHANSVVVFDISNFSDTYKYFSAYAGLANGASKSDGILARVDFSQDGKNWTTQPLGNTAPSSSTDGTQFVGYNQDFIHFTYDVTGVKWIRLFANKNGSDAQDQVLWTDAKLTTALDEGEAIKPLSAYDAEIKAFGVDADLNDPSVELLVLQREFVNRVGQYALKRFMGESADNKVMLNWLLNDLDSLREFMLGGTPFGGSYYNSLNVLAKLYKNYKTDFNDSRPLNNKWFPDRTYAQLYRTMMFSVALTHDKTIGSYLQASRVENQSEPLRRYAIFKYMYQTERFVATRNADGTWAAETMNLFGSLRVEEMRWLMCNIIDDESILWLNDYVQTRINANPKNVGNLYTPHSYVKYIDPNYNNPVFYAEENIEYFNDLFAVDDRNNPGQKIGLWDTCYEIPGGVDNPTYTITITQGTPTNKVQKVWMNFKNKFGTGSVCGGISKSGTNIRTSRGIPASVIGQPGHAAILYYSKDANGIGSWKIDNDVGGWLAATKNERHLLGWGNEAWQRNSGGTVVYFHLAQACLNDYDNLVKAEEYTWLAKVYRGDWDKQEKLYEKALKTQILNLDAWYGLAMTYKANTTKTAADFSNLAGRIADTLWNHPVAMHCLFRLFTDETNIAALKDPLFTTQIKTIEVNALAKAKSQGSTAAKSKVSYLLGNTDTSVADFSFDGENAGCIVWADTYSDGSFVWKYSLDGKNTWKEVTFNEGDSHAYQLPEEDLAAISADNDIYVYIVGASPDNAYRIDVASKPTMPDTLYANDWENRVIGVDGTYEWRYCTGIEIETETGIEVNYTPTTGWISYTEASPNCSGDKVIEVRLKGTAKKPASDGRIFTFTADTDTAERKYISVNYLSLIEFSTQSQDASRPNYAVNAIDGNAKTYWHTDYTINIKTSTQGKNNTPIPEVKPYLIIKLDVPRYISGLEFVQYQYNASFSIFAKNVTVYVSEDGKTWKQAGMRADLEEIDDLKSVHFAESVYGQYVKLEMTALYETNTLDGVFTTVSMINLYEDTTKTKSPTGEAMPSLSEVTPSGNAFAGLGDVISEDEALVVGGAPTSDEDETPNGNQTPSGSGTSSGTETPSETEPSSKSLIGLWVALSIIGVILVAAAVVFVLYKRGIIKIKALDNIFNGSKSTTNTAESTVSATKSATAESKSGATKAATNSTESKVDAAKSKTNTTKSEVKSAKPKTNTVESKADTTKSKSNAAKSTTNTAKSEVSAAKPKANTTESKSSTTKAKADTESKTSAAKAKTSTTESKSNSAKPKK